MLKNTRNDTIGHVSTELKAIGNAFHLTDIKI
jgi:hypothetical protein